MIEQKYIKQTWMGLLTDPQLESTDELKIWIREVHQKEDNVVSGQCLAYNPLHTVVNCICGNHPWPTEQMLGLADGARPTVITVAGPPRTGSTLVTQILLQLELIEPSPWDRVEFSDGTKTSVYKTHELFDTRCPVLMEHTHIFYCVRHPYDSFYSFLRLNKIPYDKVDAQTFKEAFPDVNEAAVYTALTDIPFTRALFLKNNNTPLNVIRYEDYWADEVKLIDHIADITGMSLRDIERQTIFNVVCMESAIVNSAPAGWFNRRGPNAGDHAAHVGKLKGKPGQGSELPLKFKEYIYTNFENTYERFGYNLTL